MTVLSWNNLETSADSEKDFKKGASVYTVIFMELFNKS